MDQLAILGKAVDHEDQIDYILEGLPDEYKTVVDQIEGRDTPPTITELHEKLLNHEAKLLAATDVAPVSTPVTANAAKSREPISKAIPWKVPDLWSSRTLSQAMLSAPLLPVRKLAPGYSFQATPATG